MLFRIVGLLLAAACCFSCEGQAQTSPSKAKASAAATKTAAKPTTSATGRNPYYSRTDTTRLRLSDAQWKQVLSPEVYRVARGKDTERPFTGKYWNAEAKGTYYCAACGNALFRSTAKFASECGWPSFFEPLRTKAVRYEADNTLGMERTEVLCGRCDSHLGHIFNDGPPPTGQRYCMNSIVLDFVPSKSPAFGVLGN
ncbi:peptide-methionine (R)-S-oxide reductase [Hymenobacter sediminis]|uniref:peptide-methionine (R)-S-oxide reductase MsrB n=1 Tax=Hymenobacter sediminis TaxID=2218621 RepID=UPI000DA6704E|nr:peptide-methionine (R)-S-oxide reductase MsrB [Hymenobacter sediminis]RPD47091.1 peptide-methionine (R)-S-oxide reductase [Hymenobacter sediminis]